MKDWIDFKKTFTQEQEDALWQYFIDHSKIEHSGFIRITFGVRDMNDFWKRVYARYTGDFSRYDKLEKQQKQQELAHVYNIQLLQMYDEIIARINKEGTVWEKFMLWVHRKTRIRLFGERPKSFADIKKIRKQII